MTDTTQYKLSAFFDDGNIADKVNFIKFWLMPFVFFALLGFPVSGVIGSYVTALSNFAALSFFIFCGFFVLAPHPEMRMIKLKKALKRSWKFFLIMLAVYFALNVAYMAYLGELRTLFSAEYFRLSRIFDFLVLNFWPFPMGGSIWFVQSLAYSYLIIYLIEKLKLSKIYLPLLIVLIIFMLLSGEFARLVGFPYLGYYYIPGGTITKALPFMLIGMFIRKLVNKIDLVPRIVYVITFILGIAIAVGERILLSKFGLLIYTGNAIGYGIMAISTCLFALSDPVMSKNFLVNHGKSYARRMYAFCQPVSLIVWVIVGLIDKSALATVQQFNSVICFAICFVLAYLVGVVKYEIAIKKGRLQRN